METNKKEQTKKSAKIKLIAIISIIILLLAAGTFLAIKILNKQKPIEIVQENVVKEEVPQVQIFSGTDRSIAVMIDNNTNAWPQAGIDKAYIVYEIIVEGGETRLMAVFKGVDLDKIGPVRSSRHYFLDYALENDAIYAHLGWSPEAQSQISTLGVDNINGQYYDTGASRTTTSKYWREKGRSSPHDAFTNTEMLLNISKEKGYRTTSDKESILNYATEEIELTNGTIANTVAIPYSGNSNVVKYEYDAENKVYTRYSKGTKQSEAISGNTVTTKNIIITLAKNTTLNDGENKGRQELANIGTLDGYYITNGKSIKIKCEKSSRTAQTVYKDLDGNEIKVNDGNTFIQICPINANITIN